MTKQLIEKTIEKSNINCSKAGESLTGLQRMYLVIAFEELNNLLKPDLIKSVCDHYYPRSSDGYLLPCEFCKQLKY